MATCTLTLDELADRAHEELAVSAWLPVTQPKIDAFADAVGDRQWIHVDPLRAAAESPFETTIAHGFFVLALAGRLLTEAVHIRDAEMAVNYGLNRVRFTDPVHTGASIRVRVALRGAEKRPESLHVTWGVTVERQYQEKPCCVAEWLVRYYRAGVSTCRP